MADDARPELESLLLESRTVREHLDDFGVQARYHLAPGTHCSISLRHRGRDRLGAASDSRPAACDEAEFRAAEGPCVTAMEDLRVVLVMDVEQETRWDAWVKQTKDVGFRSSAAVPAHVAEGAEIALNLYSDRVDPWDSHALTQADQYAQQIARTVGLCLQVAQMTDHVRDLEQAVAARDVINQAVGVVMATNGCTATEALSLLRGASVSRNVDMVDVADAFVRGVTGHDANDWKQSGDEGPPYPV